MNDPTSSVTQRLDALQKRVESACRNAGRDPAEVTLLLATKTIPADRLPEAVRAGQMRFGENRIQEGLAKSVQLANAHPDLAAGVRWEMIGHLQTNKINQALRFVSAIQSVDRLRLVNRLQARLERDRRTRAMLISGVWSDLKKRRILLVDHQNDHNQQKRIRHDRFYP